MILIPQQQVNFFDQSLTQLTGFITSIGEPAFRAKQIWEWVYRKGSDKFELMSNIPFAIRSALNAHYSLAGLTVSKELTAKDRVVKWLLKMDDSNEVETVFIPERRRGTLCISSQVGCTLTCSFCHTGTQKLVRNLTTREIVGQLLHAQKSLLLSAPQHKIPEDQSGAAESVYQTKVRLHPNSGQAPSSHAEENLTMHLTNIVLMGMGEPLLNYDNVARALKIIMDKNGLGISRNKITLSTSGIVPQIKKCAEDLGVNLAISLHTVHDALRSQLIPINKKYPISELLAACANYADLTKGKRITFEYVMLDGVNDTLTDAKQLVKLLIGLPAKVNLIPFNPWPGTEYRCSKPHQIRKFARVLEEAGYESPVRTPRGQDILAACGQLKSTSCKKRRSLLTD